MCVYRALSRQSQEVVLNAAHVAAATDVDVLQMSGLEFIFGQHVPGHGAVVARGLHEQNHLVALDLRIYELLRHFKADDRRKEGRRKAESSGMKMTRRKMIVVPLWSIVNIGVT